jgi:hypothetical protein
MTQEELNQLPVVQDAANRGVTAEIEGDVVVLCDRSGYTLPQQTMRVSPEEVEQTLREALDHPYRPK